MSADRKWSASPNQLETTKFPDFDPSTAPSREHLTIYEDHVMPERSTSRSPSNLWSNPQASGEKWMPRRTTNGASRGASHGRQPSLSDALKTIRTRQGSVSANALEVAQALKAPVSYKLIVCNAPKLNDSVLIQAQALCLIWYMSSALTNTSSKSILNAFPKPITLTVVQFAFVSFMCWMFSHLGRISAPLRNAVPALKDGIRAPTRDVINTTLPLALFQLGGHVLSSTATQKIPVSLVHTIKGLSPLFTVLAYRLIYKVHYTTATYLSLVPLTAGVMLACSAEFSGNLIGILYAFIAAIIFVSQNIFSKKLFNEAARAEADALPPSQYHKKKLDKLNLLFYCSSIAFVLTFPLWVWTEGLSLLGDILDDGKVALSRKPEALDHGPLALEFIFNGVFHFGQNIIAFVLLSMTSPVTYSVASLIKRVFVVTIAILWFRNPTSSVQALGIALTFLGLYLYDRTHDSARSAKHIHKVVEQPILPLNTGAKGNTLGIYDSPVSMKPRQSFSTANGFTTSDQKRESSLGPSRPRRTSRADWLPPGTKQEETWASGR